MLSIDRHPIKYRLNLSALQSLMSAFLQAIEKFKPGDKVIVHVLRGKDLVPKDLAVTLGAYKGSAFSKIESERPQVPGSDDGMPAMNIPLKDIAPAITPQLPPT